MDKASRPDVMLPARYASCAECYDAPRSWRKTYASAAIRSLLPMSGCPAKAVEGSVERSERETLVYFAFEAIELRPATVGCVLTSVEQANP